MILGWVADALALPAAAFTVGSVGLLAGAVFAFLVPETLKRDKKSTPFDQAATEYAADG